MTIPPIFYNKCPFLFQVNHIYEVRIMIQVTPFYLIHSLIHTSFILYNLIKYFGEKTGIPVVLNTSFNDKNMPIVIYDGIKEYPQSGEWCNLRSSKSILMERFPSFDFSNLKTEHDTTWQRIRLTKGEELILLNTRICQFLKWIETRDEEKIAVVSHSSFLGQMMYGKMGDEKNELKHCHPYQFTLTI